MNKEQQCWTEYSDDYDDPGCIECDGSGEILVCIDDICHGLGYCIHGDGMIICPKCNGGD